MPVARGPLKIVAFDLGATFAWATNLDVRTRWGRKTLPGIRSHRLGDFAKFLRLSSWLARVDAVIYETPFARGRDATRSLWGMAGVLEAAATEHGLPITDVAVSTIKSKIGGHGHASKAAMIAAARKLGYGGDNEHEADAYCLLKYGEEFLERGE